MGDTTTTTIRVAVRVRPLSDGEVARGYQSCIDCIPNKPQVVVRSVDKTFMYNYVFGPDSSQGSVYSSSVKPLVDQLFKGYNATILAYGQTGSGKTFSMGTCYNGEGEMGIIPRSICDIFEIISSTEDLDVKVSASFMELYNDQLFDLLACYSKPRKQCVVEIREDNHGIHIPGLVNMELQTAQDALRALMMGSSGHATGATMMNATSSRSHAIFTITIQMCKKNNGGGDTVSKFRFVDLAGSERSKKSGATGERFKESVNINKGLLALGIVISALGDGQQFVSYRDSKLTRLLQDSLGGNSMTLMVACVSPADYNCDESINTLQYADRARHIRNKPVVNKNTELPLQLLGSGIRSGGAGICPKEHSHLEEENIALKQKNHKLTEALNNAISEKNSLIDKNEQLSRELEDLKKKIKKPSDPCKSNVSCDCSRKGTCIRCACIRAGHLCCPKCRCKIGDCKNRSEDPS